MNALWHRYLPKFIRDRLEGRYSLQAAISNTGWLFADKILRMGVGVFVGVWLARYLGPQQFGLWNYALALTALLGGIATLGLDGIVVRELVRNPDRTNVLLGTAFVLKISGGAITVFVAIIAVSFTRNGEFLTLCLVVLSASAFIFQSLNVIDLYFQAKVQSRYTIYAGLGALLPMTLVKVVLLLASAPLIGFAWAGLVETALTAGLLAFVYKFNRNQIREWRVDAAVARELMRDSWPLVFAGFAIMIQARLDQVMLGVMVGDDELGQYSAAMRIIEVFAFVPMIMASTLAPYVAKAKATSESLYLNRLTNIYRLMFLVFIVVALPLFFLGKEIVMLLYGNGYERAGVFVPLFAARLFFAYFGVVKALFITNEHLFRYSLITAIVGAFVNVVANLILIPLYQAEGAIVGAILSFTATVFVCDLFSKKARGNLVLMVYAMCSPHKIHL